MTMRNSNGTPIPVPVPDDPIDALYGMLADSPSLTAELLKERERDKEREESRA